LKSEKEIRDEIEVLVSVLINERSPRHTLYLQSRLKALYWVVDVETKTKDLFNENVGDV